MKYIHRAWGVCFGCALMFFCTSGLVTNAFSIYLPYILAINHFTNTQVSSILTVRSCSSFIAMFLTGVYYHRISLRKGMVLSGCFVIAGFFIYGLSTTYVSYLVGAVIVGFGYGFGSMVPIGIILNRWFETDLSFATGICACVTGLSTLGLPTLITILIENIGLGRTFILESGFMSVLMVFSGLLLKDSPEKAGCKAYRRSKTFPEQENVVSSEKIRNYRPVIKGKVWILLAPAMIIVGSYTSAAYSHLSVLMTGEGISAQTAAIVILISGLAITSSKLIYGWLAEKITAFRCNWLFGILTFAGMFLCVFTRTSTILMGTCIVIYSAGLGMYTVGLVVWAKELSEPKDFEKTNRWFQVLYAAGGLLFSTFPGIVADHCGGSYIPAFFCFAFGSLFVMLVIQAVYIFAMKD